MTSLLLHSSATACRRHASDQELDEFLNREDLLNSHVATLVRTVPACHEWPLPERPAEQLDEVRARAWLAQWQARRCAGCGDQGDLVVDHDHHTGMVRGLLCKSCNTREPHAPLESALGRYRTRPPVLLLGLRAWPYWSPFAKEASQPVAQHSGEAMDPDRLADPT